MEIVVPPELGYGERQAGKIPASSTLKFEIELLDFKAAEAKK
ncbi:FKBP-type peptidyl-prolyl cis-trans isomerase [Actinobacillus pleuropneumoniae serovar 6 str. Femo]|nr:FKBP-type peptidyl-prolyl cis-trans isomerase [Actinobacillus pleuropneumoniae serovar 6 str. Femo]